MAVAMPQWTVGARMKEARRNKKISILFMAEHLQAKGFKASEDTVRSWEQNRHQPTNMLDILAEWASLTDVTVEWLATGSDLRRYLDPVALPDGQLELAFVGRPVVTLVTEG